MFAEKSAEKLFTTTTGAVVASSFSEHGNSQDVIELSQKDKRKG
jgi:hypothetical protein